MTQQQQQQQQGQQQWQGSQHGGPGHHGHGPGHRPPPLPGTDGHPVRADYELKLKVQAAMATMNDEQKSQLGHSVSDLIVDCEFAGTTCNTSYVHCIDR